MSINANKTYRVLNYCESAISVSTRNESIMIDGGKRDNPAAWNFTIDELQQINNKSKVFRVGRLRFDPEDEDALYKELKIFDYKDILTDEQIEEIILNPTEDGISRILNIKDRMYFERIYGIFIGMRNAGYKMSLNLENILRARFAEISRGHMTTEIQINPAKLSQEQDAQRAEIESLKRQLDEMRKMMANVLPTVEEPTDTAVSTSDAAAVTAKPKTRTTKAKSAANKS